MHPNEKIVSNSRFALQVRRYHTWPVLQKETTVGEHTAQVLRIYLEIFGPPSPEVSATIIRHDMSELRLGDLPFPIKAQNPDLAKIINRLEDETMAVLMNGVTAPAITDEEKLAIKVCDLIEMWEYGMVEVAMGNRFGKPIVAGIELSLGKLAPSGSQLRARIDPYLNHMSLKFS